MKAAVILAAFLSAQGVLACSPAPEFVEMQAEGNVRGQMYIALPPPPVSRPFEIGLLACGSEVRDIKVRAVMPAHNHGMNYVPVVAATDAQKFDVSGLVFHMPGVWRIEVVAAINGTRERHTIEAIAR